MHFGLFGINQDGLCQPDAAADVARAAESAGFESLWAGEHPALPDPRIPESPMEPTDPILDPIVSLAFLAAVTHDIKLGTGVLVLPQRQPVLLAKELASLDILCKGRLQVGVGVGYLEPELLALGAQMANRGARSDEYLEAMAAIWSGVETGYRGRFISFVDVSARPLPRQSPRPPLVVGGRTAAAHRRAIRYGDEWYGFNMSPEEASLQVESIRRISHEIPRPISLGPLAIDVTPRDGCSLNQVDTYERIGVHRLILRLPRPTTRETSLEYIQWARRKLMRQDLAPEVPLDNGPRR
jgi:probable F420-dependent oxidoreductase